MVLNCKPHTKSLPSLSFSYSYIPSPRPLAPGVIEATKIQPVLKISPGCSLEGMMLKLKLQYFGHLMRRVDSLEKTDAGRDWGQEKGTTEDEMAGWHHRLDGHEFE